MSFAISSSSSVFAGKRVSAARVQRRSAKAVAPKAKYGDESQYFDLQDLESTTGSWDVYGVQDTKRYPELQNAFFERAAAAVSRREAIYSFVALSGSASLLLWGAVGSKQAGLPITIGPLQKAPLGPRDRL